MERLVGNDARATGYLDDGFRGVVATGLAEAVYVAVAQTQPALPMDAWVGSTGMAKKHAWMYFGSPASPFS